MDVTKIEERITPRTRAIIPVHLYGQSADMDAILEIARRGNLRVIERQCSSDRLNLQSKSVSTIGDIGCLSFFQQNLGAYGDGGMVVTNSEDLAKRLRSLRSPCFREEILQ